MISKILPVVICAPLILLGSHTAQPETVDSAGAAQVIAKGNARDAEELAWPFLRGPRYDGRSMEVGLADSFPMQGPPVRWTRPFGSGYSGLTASHGRVFTQYQTLQGQFVVCLDAGSGKQPTLTVADIPQTVYRDWSAILLPVEPEYAMDVPTLKQIRAWYLASLGCLALAALLPALALFTPWGSMPKFRRDAWLLAVALGTVAPTALGYWTGEFYFTWPLALFCFLLIVVRRAVGRGDVRDRSAWRSRIPLFLFVAVCLAYFRLCGRLSLATEWVFLIGFPAAIPFLAWTRGGSRLGKAGFFREISTVILGFSAYYWASVGVLYWKYSW